MNTTVAARLPSHLYEKFIEKVEELGISKSEALVRAIQLWLEGATAAPQPQPTISNNAVIMKSRDSQQQVAPAPQVQPQTIVIVLPWMGQQMQLPPQALQALSSIPQLSSVQQQSFQVVPSTTQVRKQEEEPALVVPKSALVEPPKDEAVKAGEASDILEEIESNPWFSILQEKGKENGQ